MAKQIGIIKLQGTIGDITFYKSQDGFMARQKGGVDGDRIATDPAFERTRENGAEFGRAGKAGKLLRVAMQGLLQNASDSRLASRLTGKNIECDPLLPIQIDPSKMGSEVTERKVLIA